MRGSREASLASGENTTVSGMPDRRNDNRQGGRAQRKVFRRNVALLIVMDALPVLVRDLSVCWHRS